MLDRVRRFARLVECLNRAPRGGPRYRSSPGLPTSPNGRLQAGEFERLQRQRSGLPPARPRDVASASSCRWDRSRRQTSPQVHAHVALPAFGRPGRPQSPAGFFAQAQVEQLATAPSLAQRRPFEPASGLHQRTILRRFRAFVLPIRCQNQDCTNLKRQKAQ